jgi:hypothetical protein
MTTYQSIVENHCVRLPAEADVPEKLQVYIPVPTSHTIASLSEAARYGKICDVLSAG